MEFSTERCVGSVEMEEAEFNHACLEQLQKLLRKVDYIEGLYPTLRALGDAKPLYVSMEFQARLAAMISWANLVVRLQLLVTMLQRWTGSPTLELYSTSAETQNGKEFQHTPFVERLLKENGLQRIFEQKMMVELEQAIASARQELVENAAMYKELGLSVAHNYLTMLLRFPPRLLQTCLKIRLKSADNLSSPTAAQVDQLLADFRDSLAVACRVKRSFLELTKSMDQWSTDAALDPEYDIALHSCLQT
ncbi:Suppressor of Sensor Kinase (SLN1), partial [Linderina pennispora]